MTENDTAINKSIVQQLDFDAKTAKRVGWEIWEFTIVGPHRVKVTNASYGFQKADHSYEVGIEKSGGVPVPAECDCPADVHREPDCKHKVALATMSGTTALNSAVDVETRPIPFPESASEKLDTRAHKFQRNGSAAPASEESNACPNGNERCDGPNGEGLPCFDCFEVEQ